LFNKEPAFFSFFRGSFNDSRAPKREIEFQCNEGVALGAIFRLKRLDDVSSAVKLANLQKASFRRHSRLKRGAEYQLSESVGISLLAAIIFWCFARKE